MMHGRGKSDSVVVAVKPTNKAEVFRCGAGGAKGGGKGNASQHNTHRAQYRISVPQALERIRPVAVRTRGGSRMRESRMYGSVRGALSNERPYRDRHCLV